MTAFPPTSTGSRVLPSHSTRRFNGPPEQTVRQASPTPVTQRLGCACVCWAWRNVAAWDAGERDTQWAHSPQTDRQTGPTWPDHPDHRILVGRQADCSLSSIRGGRPLPPRHHPIGRASSQPRNLSKLTAPRRGRSTRPGPQHPAVKSWPRPDQMNERQGSRGPSLRPAFGRSGRPPPACSLCQLREAKKQRGSEKDALAFSL